MAINLGTYASILLDFCNADEIFLSSTDAASFISELKGLNQMKLVTRHSKYPVYCHITHFVSSFQLWVPGGANYIRCKLFYRIAHFDPD
jgi:hypothetical protein